jgi:hypothetical protein
MGGEEGRDEKMRLKLNDEKGGRRQEGLYTKRSHRKPAMEGIPEACGGIFGVG